LAHNELGVYDKEHLSDVDERNSLKYQTAQALWFQGWSLLQYIMKYSNNNLPISLVKKKIKKKSIMQIDCPPPNYSTPITDHDVCTEADHCISLFLNVSSTVRLIFASSSAALSASLLFLASSSNIPSAILRAAFALDASAWASAS
jgi:hypothetical protein